MEQIETMDNDYEEYEDVEIFCEGEEKPYAKARIRRYPTEEELLQAHI